MTSGKAALLTAGLVGVVALGVVTAPTIRNHWSKMNTETTTTAFGAGRYQRAGASQGEATRTPRRVA